MIEALCATAIALIVFFTMVSGYRKQALGAVFVMVLLFVAMTYWAVNSWDDVLEDAQYVVAG